MGLIIKKIQKMMVGYPTVSDKYNITGGILSGSDPVNFGDLVMFDGGYYKKVASASSVAEIAGFVLATNVKLARGFADNVVQVNPGEAFNLVLPGSLLAVKVAGISDPASDIAPRKQLYVNLTTGAVTISSSGTVALPGYTLTGEWELQGTDYVCEVNVA